MDDDVKSGLSAPADVTIRPWAEDDLTLLRRLNTDEMWAHLGGPETEEAVIARHQRYLRAVPGKVRMFVVMLGAEAVGNVGYWERRWKDQDTFEVGWGVLPEFQGKGIATKAMSAALQILGDDVPLAIVHAFPSVGNPASNVICRKLGFTLLGETSFEFPPGTWMTCNDWQLVLRKGD